MIPSASLHLLSQDNSIPGNRKDGFRYHHLLFVCLATPLYLWLELSFGVMLLDNIGGQVVNQDTASIEHWGRLISGLAVALLFLGGWVKLCERNDVRWPIRIAVGGAIAIVCIAVNWWAQGQLIDFYVQRSSAELKLVLWVLAGVVLGGFLVLRFWIRYAMRREAHRYLALVAGLIALLLIGKAMISVVPPRVLPDKAEHLGRERQQIATLTLVRRGIEEHIYGLEKVQRDEKTLASPEGKAFLALFPIFGSVLDMERFSRDRPDLISELMFRDWQKEFGKQTVESYRQIESQLKTLHATQYRSAKPVDRATVRQVLLGRDIAAGLDWERFSAEVAVARVFRSGMGCLDCEMTGNMSDQAVLREVFSKTQQHNIRQAVARFESPQNFETGPDGERAARTYWVPIWALLFSMLGAFTHFFKMIFTVTEYAHRLTFHAVRAADSPLANRVIANSRWVTASVVVGMALVIYFADNRITSHERYRELRPAIWQVHPIAGGLAAHWTVNAQGFFYPFTSKLRPQWLTFSSDPVRLILTGHDDEAID